MKKQLFATLIGIGMTMPAWSYLGPDDKKGSSDNNPKGANCSPATAKLTLEFNDVAALIEQGGSMFQNRTDGTAAYEVPKGSGLNAIYAGALWMGGTDVNGQLKLAALRYRQGNDFWPGPLTVTPGTGNYNPLFPVGDDATRDFGEANIDPDQCQAYDKIYTIRKAEVIRFNIWWSCSSGETTVGCEDITEPTNDELQRIYGWPAHGDVSRGQDYFLAPFYDRDEDGNYNPDAGDHPWYDDILGRDDIECGIDRRISLFGDETHWWVFNDKGNIHTETNGDPIGMEIRAQAFAFATNDEVNRMTFYNYELINRGTQTLYNTYFSQYLDADIGNYTDDYVGCDVSRGLGYALNGDLIDQADGGKPGYGENPPAIGCDFFEGPYQDADDIDNPGPYFNEETGQMVVPSVTDALANNGIVYKGVGIGYSDSIIDNERFGMRRFTYYTSTSAPPYNDPSNAAEYYNFMQGNWANGSDMFYGGLGYTGSTGASTVLSDYMFPGLSDPLNWATGGVDMSSAFPDGWFESTNNNPPADRRFVQSAGPFTLKPGAINNITVGIVFGRSTDGDLYASVEAMKQADTKAQALFDACFKILSPPDAPRLTIQELENELILTIDNPSSSNNFEEAYEELDEINIADPTVDRYYRFEGYQIYQLKDVEASVADISDPERARLVAQCDIENDIDRVINFDFDEALGFSIPVEMVDGSNNGIRHSFKLTEDKFAQGSPTLVNHKTYYYVAVAYAYNQFKEYNPEDPTLLDGQRKPYISSRLNFDGTAISSTPAVPHAPIPEAGGTLQLIEYGSSPQITRLDGFGNGNRDLELTQESIDEILAQGSMLTPTYDYGKGPINIKVVDPLNLASGYFECKFRDYTVQNSGNAADTASWVIYRYASEDDLTPLDSATSQRTIAFDNEQIVPEWGISVQIKQEKYFVPASGNSGGPETKTTTMISSSINFADSSKQWLTGVNDNDAYYPTNWVICGEYDPDEDTECLDDGPSYLNPCNYQDEITKDQSPVWEGLLEGIIAPHQLVGYQADYAPMAYLGTVATNVRKNAAISFAPSVDIVFTSNQELWTRCPVFETGRDAGLNIGGVAAGKLRMSPSVGKDGLEDGSGTGMGWFPGYAIDLETGARLYMAFGENSFLGGENGADMIWNPTSNLVSNVGTPLMGGVHPIYVYSKDIKTVNGYSQSYDLPAYNPVQAETSGGHQLKILIDAAESSPTTANCRPIYATLSWVCYPMLAEGQELLSTDVTMKLRINKEYKNYVASGQNSGKPMYSWSMDDIATVTASQDQLKEALDIINIVPNPYYAFSEYERNRLETKVKITNLPEQCTVKIFTVNGKLVREFKKDSPITSLDWDLTNFKAIPVASGIYLIHVSVPNVGERVLKFFGGMRQVDLQGI
ncbi:MAG: T9SS type A sorting domain-containing protein [Crocinitomicaceae bacterium]|nr:T9SS type A sorting domain-containing protein [Crocinitomicaceae bacterium]